jgi:CheY-like chemotaxis protein
MGFARRVLIVDDLEDLREMYATYLRSFGYEVLLAVDGAEALSIARHGRPDLIVSDLALPGMDGFELIRTLRQRGSTVPIITLSASIFPTVRETVMALGANLALQKPTLPDELESEIRKMLDESSIRSTTRS